MPARSSRLGASLIVGALLLAGGCGRDQGAVAPTAAPVSAPAPPPSPPPAAARAKKPRMICRDSQTGAKARCGAPNAVLVGVETD